MRRVPSQPLLKHRFHCEEIDCEEGETCSLKNGVAAMNQESEDDKDDRAEQLQCTTLHIQEPPKRGERPSWKKYGLWRQDQKTSAARLEKQLKGLEERIDKQLSHFHVQYNRAMLPTRLKHLPQLLMPKSTPPHELATLSWLGDWRPTAILGLLRSLVRSSCLLSSECTKVERTLSQLIHEIRIEEAVIDEEMAEIQANCILHLPFSTVNKYSGRPALACIRSEFEKIHRVIVKAQNLRFKALEIVVKKVLGQTDAAEFLVAFAGIQETVHQFTTNYKLQKGPVSVPLGSSLGEAEFERIYSRNKDPLMNRKMKEAKGRREV